MIFTYEIGDDEEPDFYDFEPDMEQLTKALAIAMITEAKEEPTENNIRLVMKIISNCNFAYDDFLLEQYEALLHDILRDEAMQEIEDTY